MSRGLCTNSGNLATGGVELGVEISGWRWVKMGAGWVEISGDG